MNALAPHRAFARPQRVYTPIANDNDDEGLGKFGTAKWWIQCAAELGLVMVFLAVFLAGMGAL